MNILFDLIVGGIAYGRIISEQTERRLAQKKYTNDLPTDPAYYANEKALATARKYLNEITVNSNIRRGVYKIPPDPDCWNFNKQK